MIYPLVFLCCITTIYGIPYEIAVYTGNVFGAGTDAKVFITLYGDRGKSPEKELDTKNNNDFERDHVDTYKLDFPDEGTLKHIKIRHDNSWFGSGWFLEKVVIKDPRGCVYTFPCHKWLAANSGDKKLARILDTKSVCEDDIQKNTVCVRGHALGMNNNLIKDSQITASSSYDDKHTPFHARLNKIVKGSRGSWCSAFADDTEYLQITFKDITSVGGIATQGQAMFNNWVTKYSLSYNNGSKWQDIKEHGKTKIFTGNKDRETVVRHDFKEVKAKAIRIHPLAWEGLTNCLRVELYGCEKDNPSLQDSKKSGTKPTVKKGKKTKENPTDETLLSAAALYLKFDNITGMDTIADQSDLHNDARIVNFARLTLFSEKCGRGVELNGGDVILNGKHFINKPHKAITIATWIKLYSSEGYNSVFDTIGGKNSSHSMGQYHLEIINGSVRWFHRNEKGAIIFSVLTEVAVPARIWTHVACTYDASSGYAQVFVNAKFIMREEGIGFLSQDWQARAGIGAHKGERLLDGGIDEFYISDKALTQDEIKKLMKHCEFEKECFSPIGMEDLKVADDQITASSVLEPHKPFYGRLNLISFYDDVKKSAWCSDDDDKEPYLTVNLKTEKTISGVAVQGASVFDSFVTSYKLCYSHSGRHYECVNHNGTSEALMGSEDKDNIKIHWLNKFFDARYVRFYPLSWYGENICMRVELYGCMKGILSDTVDDTIPKETDSTQEDNSACSVSCGIGVLKETKPCGTSTPSITTTSPATNLTTPDTNKNSTLIPAASAAVSAKNAKCSQGQKTYVEKTECILPSCPECFTPMRAINASDARYYETQYMTSPNQSHSDSFGQRRNGIFMADMWCFDLPDKEQFSEIDLGKPVKVTGIGTQGQITKDRWVSSYRLSYSVKGNSWNKYTEDYRLKVFKANDDKDTISIRHLKHPVTARYVRIHPVTWHGKSICMRTEIFGCDHSANYIRQLTTKPTMKASQHQQITRPSKPIQYPLKKSNHSKSLTKHAVNPKPQPTKQLAVKPAVSHSSARGIVNAYSLPEAVILPVKLNSKESNFQMVFDTKGSHRVQIIPLTHAPRKAAVPASKSHIIPHASPKYSYQNHVVIPATAYVQKTGYHPVKPVYGRPVARILTSQRIKNEQMSYRKPPNHPNFYNYRPPPRYYPSSYRGDLLGPFAGRLLKPNIRKPRLKMYLKPPFTISNIRNATPLQARVTQYNRRVITQRPKYAVGNTKSLNQMNTPINHYRPYGNNPVNVSPLLSVNRVKTMKPAALKQGKIAPSIITSSLKERFKDTLAHHFLEERFLTKEKKKELLATRMDTINPRISEYHWSRFSPCSVTCGRGVRERYRKCNAMECMAEGNEIQIMPCYEMPCKESTEWSSYTSCSVTCGTGIRTRTRLCDGHACPVTGKEIATIQCENPECPVLNYDFESIDGKVIIDKSGKSNNALMREESRVIPYKGICGHHLDLGYHGNLVLQDETFRQKPREGISIACWVNLQGSSSGSHAIFSTAKAVSEEQVLGGYHFEIDDGRVRWFHRNHEEQPVFSVVTNDVISPNTWYHLVGTYSSKDGTAKVFVDGQLQGQSNGSGELDDNWGYKASIGTFDFDGRFMRGKLDDLYIYDYEISPEQIKGLLSIKCPQKKKIRFYEKFGIH